MPLFFWVCRKYNVTTFGKAVGIGFIFYVVTALLVAAGFAFIDFKGSVLEAMGAMAFMSIYGMVLFSIVFIPLILFLAYRVKRKAERSGS